MADTEDFAVEDFDGEEEEVDIADDVPEGEEKPAIQEDPFEQLYKFHPETIIDYAETILPRVPLLTAPPTEMGADPNHTSYPFLTTYERTKILGTRTNQLADGARPFIDPVPEHITQPLEIAKLELEQRRLPFIVKRPMPDGTFEYWRLSDLLLIL